MKTQIFTSKQIPTMEQISPFILFLYCTEKLNHIFFCMDSSNLCFLVMWYLITSVKSVITPTPLILYGQLFDNIINIARAASNLEYIK